MALNCDFRPFLECNSDVILSVDRDVIAECVPRSLIDNLDLLRQ